MSRIVPLGLILVVACGSDDTAPLVQELSLTQSTVNGLVFAGAVTTDVNSKLEITVSSPDLESFTVATAADAFSTQHEFTVAGLRASTEYTVSVTATNEAGTASSPQAQAVTTDALPADFPPLRVIRAEAARMAPGNTMLNVFRWNPGENGPDQSRSFIIALDPEGEVVWYAIADGQAGDVRVLSNGHVIWNQSNREIVEVDLFGIEQRRWIATGQLMGAPPAGAITIDTDSIHHEVFVLPNGNWLTLSSELRVIDGQMCPSYNLMPGESFNVVGDIILEFEPDTGRIVQQFTVFDEMDPCRRTTRGFSAPFWNNLYNGQTTKDWTHGNAIIYDEARGVVIGSWRHSDWIVAYDFTPGGAPGSGSLAWILGDELEPGAYKGRPAFTPTGADFSWFYQTHAPTLGPNGNLFIFDNGRFRPGTNFDGMDAMGRDDEPTSRLVEVELDMTASSTSAWTVEQKWEFADTDPSGRAYYAPFLGDVDYLPNGNVLGTFGGLLDPATDGIGNPMIKKFARIVEIDRAANDEVVFEIQIEDDATSDFTGYSVYRSERVVGFPR